MFLDECGTTIHPITIVDVPDWTDQALLGAMQVSTDKAISSLAPHGLKHRTIIEVG
jgi:hypothetical protein